MHALTSRIFTDRRAFLHRSQIALVLAFWGFGLPAIMNPENEIAVTGIEVDNANLYFSSWISFAAAVFLAGSLAQETMGLDIRSAPSKQARWFGLAAASLVVLFASVRIYRNDNIQCGGPVTTYQNEETGMEEETLAGTELCKRTKLGIALGVLTFISSLGFSFGAGLVPFAGLVELGLSAVLLIMWVFGVGFITFGGNLSPGTHIGNLYFSTWISFGLVVSLLGGLASRKLAAHRHIPRAHGLHFLAHTHRSPSLVRRFETLLGDPQKAAPHRMPTGIRIWDNRHRHPHRSPKTMISSNDVNGKEGNRNNNKKQAARPRPNHPMHYYHLRR